MAGKIKNLLKKHKFRLRLGEKMDDKIPFLF